jgi:hypothetical protein
MKFDKNGIPPARKGQTSQCLAGHKIYARVGKKRKYWAHAAGDSCPCQENVDSLYILKDGLSIYHRGEGDADLDGGLFTAIAAYAKECGLGAMAGMTTGDHHFTFHEADSLLFMARSSGRKDATKYLRDIGDRFIKAYPQATIPGPVNTRLFGAFMA